MYTICTAILQALKPNREDERLGEEERVWNKLRKPVYTTMFCILILAIVIPAFMSLTIALWPEESPSRPFCDEWGRSMRLILNETFEGHDLFEDDMINLLDIRDQEAIAYYFYQVFLPSMALFLASTPALLAGMAVAYTAPRMRHIFLSVYEHHCNWLSSRLGGLCILIIVNTVFAIALALLAILRGPKVMRPGSSCSLPLFWFYEIAAWGLVILYGVISILLKTRSVGMPAADQELEMTDITPVERFIHERLQNVEDTPSSLVSLIPGDIQPADSMHEHASIADR